MEEEQVAKTGKKRLLKLLYLVVAVIILVPIFGLAYLSFTSPTREIPGVVEGKLPSCPKSPNCVCSFDDDKEHGIEPIKVEGDSDEFFQSLQEKTEQLSRVKKISSDQNYVHYEVTSLIFRYVDDLEFLLDKEAKLVHVRSASRAGHSDLGVNRKRVKEIRALLK